MIKYIIVSIIAIGAAAFMGSAALYLGFGFAKKLYHDKLGWHIPDPGAPATDDGVNVHAVCQYCHKNIIEDSQGNWFEV